MAEQQKNIFFSIVKTMYKIHVIGNFGFFWDSSFKFAVDFHFTVFHMIFPLSVYFWVSLLRISFKMD